MEPTQPAAMGGGCSIACSACVTALALRLGDREQHLQWSVQRIRKQTFLVV